MTSRRSFLVAAAGLLSAARPAAAVESTLRIAAAASLKGVLDDLASAFRAAAGAASTVTYAASSALARQIEAGAPFHVFIAADAPWMDYLEQRDRIDAASRRNVAGNALVLIAPRSAASAPLLRIEPKFPLAAALRGGRLAMANPDAVPAGRYGKAALAALGVWDAVAGRMARAENVRAALMLVARGEAPLGIVYLTDAQAEPLVQVVDTFPSRLHPPIVYPAAAIKGAPSPRARNFLDFLATRAAEPIWRRYGFTAPE